MKTVYLALLVGFLMILVPTFVGVSWGWTVLPGIAAGVAVFVVINRKYGKLVEAILQEATQELQAAQGMIARAQAQNNPQAMKVAQKAMEKKSEQAVEKLKGALVHTEWQLGAKTSLNAQIGMVIFSHNIAYVLQGQKGQREAKAKLAEAITYLDRSLVRGWRANLLQGLWHAWLRLAISHYHVSRDFTKVYEVMNQIVAVAKKEGFAWSVYAWFCIQNKDKDRAIEVLADGVKESTDPNLKANLELLRNGKSLKMGEYGGMWWNLGLELPKQMTQRAQTMPHPRSKAGRRGRR